MSRPFFGLFASRRKTIYVEATKTGLEVTLPEPFLTMDFAEACKIDDGSYRLLQKLDQAVRAWALRLPQGDVLEDDYCSILSVRVIFRCYKYYRFPTVRSFPVHAFNTHIKETIKQIVSRHLHRSLVAVKMEIHIPSFPPEIVD